MDPVCCSTSAMKGLVWTYEGSSVSLLGKEWRGFFCFSFFFIKFPMFSHEVLKGLPKFPSCSPKHSR